MRRLRVALIAIPLLLAVSCSGDDDTPARAGSTTTTIPKFSGSSDSEFCTLLNQVQSAGMQATDPASTRAAFDLLEGQRDRLIDLAPTDLEDDIATFLDHTTQLMAALEAAGFDPEKIDPDAERTVDEETYRTAVTRIGAYQQQVCAPSAPQTTPSAPATPTTSTSVPG